MVGVVQPVAKNTLLRKLGVLRSAVGGGIFFGLSVRYTARGTQQPVPEGTTHIPRVRALIRSRMYGFAKSHPEGLATRTKLRLLSERPSQAQGPQSSARRRSTRNPLPSSDKSAGRILKCPKDGALSSSAASRLRLRGGRPFFEKRCELNSGAHLEFFGCHHENPDPRPVATCAGQRASVRAATMKKGTGRPHLRGPSCPRSPGGLNPL